MNQPLPIKVDPVLNAYGKEIEENMSSYEIELNNKIYKITIFKIFDLNKIKNLEKEVIREINNSWKKSLKDPYPKEKDLLNRVYNNEK